MDVLQVKKSLYWWMYCRLYNPFTDGCTAGYTILYWWMYCWLYNTITDRCTAGYTIPLLMNVLQVIQSLYWWMYFKIAGWRQIYLHSSWIDQRELVETNMSAIFYRVVLKNIYSSLRKVTYLILISLYMRN